MNVTGEIEGRMARQGTTHVDDADIQKLSVGGSEKSTAKSTETMDWTAEGSHPVTVAILKDGTKSAYGHPKRILRLNDNEIRLLLLQTVRIHNSHTFERGKNDEGYTKVLHSFWQKLPLHINNVSIIPTVKSIIDRVRNVMTDWRSFVNYMKQQSGVEEQVSQVDDVLDDFIQKVKYIAEAKRRDNEETAELDEALGKAGILV